jgi:hypothetical protein
MDFKTATDRVAGCISHAEIAEAAGVSVQTIRQARLDPSAPGHRPPPAGWQDVLARLARERSQQLAQFAEEVERNWSGRLGLL